MQWINMIYFYAFAIIYFNRKQQSEPILSLTAEN